MSNQPREFVVIGDFGWDTFIFAENWREPRLSQRRVPQKAYPFNGIRVPGQGGALPPYLRTLGHVAHLIQVDDDDYEKKTESIESLFIVSPLKEDNRRVWRIKDSNGSLTAGEIDYGFGHFPGAMDRKNDPWSDGLPTIIMDFDKGWRKKYGEQLAQHIDNRPYLIRCHDPRKLEWHKFRDCKKPLVPAGIWACLSEDIADGALRGPGIWEDVRGRIVEWFKKDNTLWDGHQWKHYLVVRIDYDGVLVMGPGPNARGQLYISPGDQPGSFLRTLEGHVVGSGTVFIGSLAEALPDTTVEDLSLQTLESCAKKGLVRSRKVMKDGFKEPLKDSSRKWPYWKGWKQGESSEPLFKVESHQTVDTEWIKEYERPKGTWEIASAIVVGDETTFRKFTALRIGDLVTANTEYARSLLIIEDRLKAHSRENSKKVLSFAILGDPGSGKSFVAKELAKAVDSGKNTFEEKTYNLSQFADDISRLTQAFNEIGQISMSGKVPFVVWDEFDTELNQRSCGWLTYFLMPMEDAKFFEGKIARELGKCVFVFAGGIFKDEGNFLSKAQPKDGLSPIPKGMDFHSRLESCLAIPSLTLTGNKQWRLCRADAAKLERAILIRSYLKKKSIKRMSPKVIAYLLHVELRHGARSLKKIIDSSRLDQTQDFDLLHLPSEDVLVSHTMSGRVSPEKFLESVCGPALPGDVPCDLIWKSYEPMSVDDAVRDLNRTETLHSERMGEETHRSWVDQRWRQPVSTVKSPCEEEADQKKDPRMVLYPYLPQTERDSYEEAALKAIREKRAGRTEHSEE